MPAQRLVPSSDDDLPFAEEIPELPLAEGIVEHAWEETPNTSHIWGFRVYFAEEGTPSRSHELQVRFKDKAGGISAEYTYYFHSRSHIDEIAGAMRAARHPYGEVLHPKIIKPNAVPFKNTGISSR